MKRALLLLLIFLIYDKTIAQNNYVFDATHVPDDVRSGHLKMGHPGPAGKEIRINSQYLSVGGKPVVPVMGELHYSRIPRAQWKDVILKTKACGVNIIACYVIWIHHEEEEGKFDWAGNKDLRAFIELCQRYGLLVYPRIGPWVHAEVRNGGTPDWLLAKDGMKERSTQPLFKKYAEEWYRQVALQLEGLLYKNGGPVIGIQLDNEYGHGKAGEPYIMWLKATARKYGIDVPMYTVTGWGNGSVPPNEVVPLWGAYPDEPWANHLLNITDCQNYQFTAYRDNENIGNEVKQTKEHYFDLHAYPYFTCEMGLGIENTEHRRLQINRIDGLGLAMAKLGSGSNLLGYYMFAGGSNPRGRLSSLEENKESGSYNTNPVISYDFQAAIRENGELNGSYREVKKLHYFLNEFGGQLAIARPVFPRKAGNMQTVLRVAGDSGFIFGLNYCRHRQGSDQKGVQFQVDLGKEKICFPSRPVDIADSSMFIWPINLKMGKLLLKYGTAQPLCHIDQKQLQQWFFVQDAAVEPEMCFSDQGIISLKASYGKVKRTDHTFLISGLKPGADCVIDIETISNHHYQVVILSKEEAKQVWLFQKGTQKALYLSDAGMYPTGDSLHVFSGDPKMTIRALRSTGAITKLRDVSRPEELFRTYQLALPVIAPEVKLRKLGVLDEATWLRTSVSEEDSSNQLYHRFLFKKITLANSSPIKSVELNYFSDTRPVFRINERTVNQDPVDGHPGHLDLTGYIQKGSNSFMAVFPVEKGDRSFAAQLTVTYENYDQVIFNSDTSWRTAVSYQFPSATRSLKFDRPVLGQKKQMPSSPDSGVNRYALSIGPYDQQNIADMILSIKYAGNRTMLFRGGELRADDLYNGTDWRISLKRIGYYPGNDLRIQVYPLLKKMHENIFFEYLPSAGEAARGIIQQVKVLPQYQADILVVPHAGSEKKEQKGSDLKRR